MGDPRFERVTWDPKFKGIGQKSRKVSIDKRFESMFTEPQFKVEYKFDKRGRKVKQSTDEDLRKYYKLDDGEEEGGDLTGLEGDESVRDPAVVVKPAKKEHPGAKWKGAVTVSLPEEGRVPGTKSKGNAKKGAVSVPEEGRVANTKSKSGKKAIRIDSKGKQKRVDVSSDESAEFSGAESADNSDAESANLDNETSDSDSEASDSEDDKSFFEEEGVEVWGEEAPLSKDTSCRLALCNMDWDHVGAKDVFVLLNSFKPAGSSILDITVYPSDLGLERMSAEDIAGPGELVGVASDENEEGAEYSEEKLRQYQLNRFKYYYAVVVCDRVETAEHIYTHCNGLEYEHSGGRLDLRFIPDDMSFDDRQAKSTATEDLIPTDFTPADFVSSALQQSKVKLSWDETDPHRVSVTQKKFTKDDLQSMNFSAYLASSSESGSDSEEEEGGGKKLRYKELLEAVESPESENEEMEITWEPGLKESVQKIVKKKKTGADGLTPWEKHLQEKKERKKEAKRKKAKKPGEVVEEELGGGKTESGFDDPFFHHSVTMATAATTKKKGKRKRQLDEAEQKERDELELLMMSDGEEEKSGSGRSHFSFPAIVRSEKDASKKRKKHKKVDQVEENNDDFKVDVSDQRFNAIFESHLYAPDPSHPQYRATQGMADIMDEKQRRRKRGKKDQQDVAGQTMSEGWKSGKVHRQDPTTGQALPDPSLNSLVKSVKTKTKLFKGKAMKRKLKLKQPEK